MPIYHRRLAANYFYLGLSVVCTAFGLFWLGWLLWTLLTNGLDWIDLGVFTRITPPPGSQGGLQNAILGSLLLTTVALSIAAPVGVLAGTYLAEYGSASRLAAVIRFVNDLLLSAPSIIIGVFIYGMVVIAMGHFSGLAGSLALALIMLPVVVRTTDDMMRLVPDSLREAAAALGAPQWKIIARIIYRAASNGILTGILLGVARISGETAPLLFTALNNQFGNLRLDQPIANLPVVIFQFAMSPYVDWQHLAWAGATLITFFILLLNILTRLLFRSQTSNYY